MGLAGMTTETPINPAATVVLTRKSADGREVLMGQRGAAAVFMPSKYVFPGGRVDDADMSAPDLGLLDKKCRAALEKQVAPQNADAIIGCALRELAEETGLTLTAAREGAFQFVFRAITPPGRSRRFDARFFLADLNDFSGDSLGFSDASDELSHLHWITLAKARALDLPFITEVVLAEVSALVAGHPQNGVPFFDNSGPRSVFRRL
jgi:8-oxo-dGTP pyrophosphatase MutT (NUDIX family)